jgi:hypothetical protein
MATAMAQHAHEVARSLGLRLDRDPIETVVDFCEEIVHGYHAELPCETLDDLMQLVANRLGTKIHVVTTQEELTALAGRYVERGEVRFAALESDLAPDVFGQTLRLQHRRTGELPFVSVVDARGTKAYRQYFTGWHELAHILALPEGTQRDSFQRSHSRTKHPEEQMMDAIAGRVAFFRPILVPKLPSAFSFEAIDGVRAELCPTASAEAMLRSVAASWPTAALLVRAERGLKKAAQVPDEQQSLLLLPPVLGEVRAVSVTRNEPARVSGLNIHRNMRVPDDSVIAAVYEKGGTAIADEDLLMWSSSDGKRLAARAVVVAARQRGDGVDVLVFDKV